MGLSVRLSAHLSAAHNTAFFIVITAFTVFVVLWNNCKLLWLMLWFAS